MRRIKEVTIKDEGRDKDKTFVLTEMPSEEGEIWAMRAMVLLEKSGFIVPEERKGAGMAGLAISARPFTLETARALQDSALDNMWQYVRVKSADGLTTVKLFAGADCQIEEWETRLKLRVEFVQLHTGFFTRGRKSTTDPTPSAAA